MKILYLLTTEGLGDYYVIAENVLEAEICLSDLFKQANYGFESKRQVINIKIIATELKNDVDGRPFFYEGVEKIESKLIIKP